MAVLKGMEGQLFKEKRYTEKAFDSLQGSCVGFVLAGREAETRGWWGGGDLINEYVL